MVQHVQFHSWRCSFVTDMTTWDRIDASMITNRMANMFARNKKQVSIAYCIDKWFTRDSLAIRFGSSCHLISNTAFICRDRPHRVVWFVLSSSPKILARAKTSILCLVPLDAAWRGHRASVRLKHRRHGVSGCSGGRPRVCAHRVAVISDASPHQTCETSP